ncbi:hypothetical protein LTR92_002514 [Exophiala xenobiotica]|nr:hypothetical protein LTR92_002514 [Exophiala xenobiotica]
MSSTDTPGPKSTTYSQGHSASVVASHVSRTVENSASFLTPHLKPSFTIVDLGCGPGTITRGFCPFVPDGRVIGIDSSPAVIEQARSLATSGPSGDSDSDLGPQGTSSSSQYPHPYANLSFRVGDITATPLPFADDSVDVVYTHQTLIHIPLPGPVSVIREIHRILKPGSGILAMREADHAAMHPSTPALEQYWSGVFASARAMGAQGEGTGRRLHLWAQEAGFERSKMQVGAGATVYTAPEEAKWWAGVHVGRLEGEVGDKWLRDLKIVRSQQEIEDMKVALRVWGESPDAWYSVMQGEVLCWKLN